MSKTRTTLRIAAPLTVNLTDPRYDGNLLFDITYDDPDTGKKVCKKGLLFADDDCPVKYLARLNVSIENAVVTPRRS